MFPWMMPNASMGGNLSLLSMLYGSGAGAPAQQSPFGNPMAPDYWSKVGATRQPGEDNSQVFFRGMLPQSMWPQQWRDQKHGYTGDRSDQAPQGNQPDTGNAMAPPGQQPPGGPDQNTEMPGYDPNTVSPGWGAPAWMQMLGGGNQRNRNRDPRAGMQMGLLGLQMMQPRPPTHTGPYPWI